MDTWSRDRQIMIQVQLTDGVLNVIVERERLFSSTTYIFVMWMVGTSMVLFAIATIFMRNQVRPIRRLATAVDNFGKGRDESDFKPEGAAEIRQAAAAFNLMRERILRAISQRTEILAGVSHDLRTVLTRLKLQLAMLGEGAEVAAMQDDVAEMENMVEEYLAFARGESAETIADTDIDAILGDIAQVARQGGAAGVNYHQNGAGALVVPVRPNAFKRCVTNLVGNAVKHAECVDISARRTGDLVEILVDDDGPGIAPESREEVFKPFYRLDSARNLDSGGSGLGLTIARDIIRAHGGDVLLEDSPGGGLRARLRLPV
jgi:two-component system osmolarity sensor histidine kinase EnvZ